MPKDPQSVVTDYTYTQNRELSWLRFNRWKRGRTRPFPPWND